MIDTTAEQARYQGKIFCYVAIHSPISRDDQFAVGIAVLGEPGYSFALELELFATYKEASTRAEELNGVFPYSLDACVAIVADTMIRQRERRPTLHRLGDLVGGLTERAVRASDKRARFIGLAAYEDAGGSVQAVAIGNKGFGFLNRINAQVVSHVVQLGDAPQLEKLIGPVKVMLDAFVAGKLDAVYLCYTKFINTMKQEPMVETLLPLGAERLTVSEESKRQYGWDYIYEPDAPTVIDELLTRYIEALVFQAVAENMASEQSARMVAMKAATDNAGNLIAELKLIYNKTRQAAITKELSEIVGGAAAV